MVVTGKGDARVTAYYHRTGVVDLTTVGKCDTMNV